MGTARATDACSARLLPRTTGLASCLAAESRWWPQPIGGSDCADFDRLRPQILGATSSCGGSRAWTQFTPDNASPGDGYSHNAWIDLAGGDCGDRNAHHNRDDRQCELSPSAALLRRLCATGLQSLLAKLRSARLRNILDPLGQALGDVLVVFRT
jgi:hypothetical protein